MANYNKSFNFRNGVQVDNDNFIVNANGLVGIGTSIPTEFLDVHGTAKVTGLVTARNLAVTGVSTFYSDVKVGSAITFNPSTGAARATTFYGSAAGLTGIYALAVDGWYVNAGNISTTSNVGIGTTLPYYSLQVGLDPLTGNGLSVDAITGDVNTTGIVTAYSFTGFGTNLQGLNATNITNGTLSNSRLPQDISVSGIITASTGVITSLTNTNLNNTGIATLGVASASRLLVSGVTTSTGGFVGNVTGTATTATSLTGSPNITVSNVTSSNINNIGIITSSRIISELSSIGISTVSTRLYAESIGVGTNSPSGDIHIRRSSTSTLQVTSDTAEAIIAVGRSTTLNGNNGALRFGNNFGIYPYSNSRTLDIINYGTGNLNSYLNYSSGSGNIGDFNWIYAPDASNPLMTLTYGGNLGIGITNPSSKLEVLGNANVSSLNVSQNITATGAGTSTSVRTLYVYGGKSQILNSDGTEIFPPEAGDQNVNIASGISTFFNINVTNHGFFGQKIGIGNTTPLEPLHIGGDYLINPEDAVVINSSGIGIGRTSIRFGLGIDAEEVDVVFGTVGIGTTSTDSPEGTRLLVNGPSNFYGNLNATGVSTFAGITTVTGPTLFTKQLNVSGVSTFAGITTVTGTTLFSRQLSVSGVTTSQNGFTSGIGVTNPVRITVSGNILTFTVTGVGSTSLTLF